MCLCVFALQAQRNFDLRSFQTWLRSRLKTNPFGVTCCVANGRQLYWQYTSGTSDLERKPGRIATNAHMVPKDNIRGYDFSFTCILQFSQSGF